MNLLVILAALGVGLFGIGNEPAALSANLMRRWRDSWLGRGQREGWASAIALLFIVLVPAALTAVVWLTLRGYWHGLLSELLSFVALSLVLLDQRWPAIFQRERDAWRESDNEHREAILHVDHATVTAAADAEFTRVRRSLLATQLAELFSPLFWFILLGPIAAIAYYFLRLTAESESTTGQQALGVLRYADWPVARVLALSLALAGNFVASWPPLRRDVFSRVSAVDLLDDCASAAQPESLPWSADSLPGETLSQALLDIDALMRRALVIWIVALSLHVLWP